jgi:glycosidase
MNHLLDKIKIVYPDQYETVYQLIVIFIRENKMETKAEWVTEEDVMLITYGDSILSEKSPLQTLYSFLSTYVKDSLSAVHLLPMFPYTSDDGFSVVDYMKINPNLGTWDDIKTLSSKYDLMFDAVVNHISKSSEWFEEYKKGNKEYHNFFKEVDLTKDYSQLIRPRALPFYYPYMTKEGSKNIWATFSEDQVDLNYENPLVLIKVLEVLVEYAKRGAKYIRLEAIGFIWKLDQSPSMHLKETHALVQIMREVVDLCVEGTILITETNVPHIDNISYLGGEEKEAHMVYQFPLPPVHVGIGISQKIDNFDKVYKFVMQAQTVIDIFKVKRSSYIQQFEPSSLKFLFQGFAKYIPNDFSHYVLGDIEETEKEQVKELIYTYIKANGSIKSASEELYVHKNTFQYRLNKVKEQLGYNPRNLEDLIILYIALELDN